MTGESVLKRTVKVEVINTPTTKRLDVSERLMECGEIHNLYPCKNSSSETTQYFVEFKDNWSAERALKLVFDPPQVRIYSLAMNPSLVREFCSNTPSLSEHATSQSGQVPSTPTNGLERGVSQARSAVALRVIQSAPPLLLASPELTPTNSLFQSLRCDLAPISKRESHPDRSPQKPAPYSSSPAFSPKQPISLPVPTSPLEAHPSPLSPLNHISSHPSPSLAVGAVPPSTLEKRIRMSLCGEIITYDLDALEEDPRVIIHLLKATSSERGNWMTVGGQYRRKGNPSAALAVITAMIEVLTECGVPGHDLKPAFLMLSGCETDLAKKATKEKQPELSAEHYHKAERWVQKVYGTQSPTTQSPTTQSPTRGGHPVSGTFGCREPPTPTDCQQAPDNVSSSPSRRRSLSPSHIHTLKREVRCLRDRQADQESIINEVRSAKRKLESDFLYERNLRRKLERQLYGKDMEIEVARKRENYTLDLMKKEVDSRRQAERRAEEERDRRQKMEVESKAVKPMLEDLANILQRAANGEGIGPSSQGVKWGLLECISPNASRST